MSSEFITDVGELIRILGLTEILGSGVFYGSDYSFLVPRDFVKLMEFGNPFDPLLLQVLPRVIECDEVSGFLPNPLEEQISAGLPILKKYKGRALLMPTCQCGIHCRFCFRRHVLPRGVLQHGLQSSTREESISNITAALDLVMSDVSISEVIISGGDPLIQGDEQIKEVLDYIEKIPHVKRVRIHSRYLVVQPRRITEGLNFVLSRSKPVYLVLHVNHPRELSVEFLSRLRILSAPVILSQTVLLRGINDDIEVLSELFGGLADNRVIPYYLHQLDRVSGAAHFEVSIEEGCKLIRGLRERLSGYAIPRYVQETTNENCKRLLM
ncbi:MAG: KamA family radical SAM protein [Planctomycetaceae bacterium]|jgi:EF-P beta-lysylation protein EpmB|nr:KamA family radical SAM protein [Planctomycetaceae bacterium]